MTKEPKIWTCSFCGEKSADVDLVIAGRGKSAICNECVEICNKIIEEYRIKRLVRKAMEAGDTPSKRGG